MLVAAGVLAYFYKPIIIYVYIMMVCMRCVIKNLQIISKIYDERFF